MKHNKIKKLPLSTKRKVRDTLRRVRTVLPRCCCGRVVGSLPASALLVLLPGLVLPLHRRPWMVNVLFDGASGRNLPVTGLCNLPVTGL